MSTTDTSRASRVYPADHKAPPRNVREPGGRHETGGWFGELRRSLFPRLLKRRSWPDVAEIMSKNMPQNAAGHLRHAALATRLCPGRGRRIAVLVCRGGLFRCRHCYKLKYSSQLESDMDRARRQINKLEARMDRKGIHQATRARLMARLNRAIERENEAFCCLFARVFGRKGRRK